MNAGELRDWVAFWLPDLISDGQGGDREVIPVGIVYDTPANVRQMSGSETQAGDQVAQRNRYEVTIRYMPDVTPVYRIAWRDLYLQIERVQNVEMRDTWLSLTCSQWEAGQQ